MTQHTKYISLILLSGALVSLILLAASLSNLQLHSGTTFLGGGNSDNTLLSVDALPSLQTHISPILQGFLALLFLILLVYVTARLIVFVNLKIVLQSVLVMVILLTIVYIMPRTTLGQSTIFPGEYSEITTPPAFTYPFTPLGEPPQILIWLVIIGLGLGMSLSTIKIVKQRLDQTHIEDELLQGAENAVNSLKAGMDLRSVIMGCYFQMTRSLQEEQGIERDFTMTVREFEHRLGDMGFPTVPVHQLTSLFERARYGNQPMRNNDEEIAIECLNEIIKFFRREKDQN